MVTEIFHGDGVSAADWDGAVAADEMSDDAWREYLKRPFTSHEEYISQLKRIASKYGSDMHRSNNKGTKGGDTMMGILQKGASFSHYMYLRNCNLFRTIAGGEQLLRGTSHNEAEHRTLKRWTECIYAQHQDRLEFVRVVHALHR